MRFQLNRVAIFLLLGLLTACDSSDPSDSSVNYGDTSSSKATFTSSTSCAECHAEQFQSWKGSHHDLAMQEVNEQSVLGNFSDVVFKSAGRSTRFFRVDNDYFVNAEGPDGEAHDYQVLYTFGVHPLQQYLVAFPGGRMQCLDVAWDADNKRWFDLNEGDRVPADDAYHWSGRFQTWNLQCADCHSTYFRKNYDAKTDTYASTWDEIDVGCEACHGAGSEHIELARSWLGSGRPADAPTGFEVALRKDDAPAVLNSCAACHSRRTALTDSHRPGAKFADDYRLALLTPDLYHADGQVLEEVYVHGSFLQSKMHQRGVSCVDCHDPHSLDLWLPGDSVCMQCHSPEAPLDRFPTLKQKSYADSAHHHHPVDSEGARCVNCHMPTETFMVIDPRRDHSLRIPRPDLTASLGAPNACNKCHTDQSSEWAAQAIASWTEAPLAPHYGVALAATDTSGQATIEALVALPFDKEQPFIVRASALRRLPPGSQVACQAAMTMLGAEESDPLVRVAALEAMFGGPAQLLVAVVPEYLADPARAVRIEAAHVLAGEAEAQLDAEASKLFASAFAEFEAAQAANADSPFSHLNLGVVAERRKQPLEAEAHYKKALAQDRDFLPAVFNLATLLESTGKTAASEQLLRDAIERNPEEGELRYSLGLLLAGANRIAECAQVLTEAARLLPDHPRVHYNLGLALSQTGELQKAEFSLLRAHQLERFDPDPIYALCTYYLDADELELARDWTKRLMEAVPDSKGPQQLMDEIERRMKQ